MSRAFVFRRLGAAGWMLREETWFAGAHRLSLACQTPQSRVNQRSCEYCQRDDQDGGLANAHLERLAACETPCLSAPHLFVHRGGVALRSGTTTHPAPLGFPAPQTPQERLLRGFQVSASGGVRAGPETPTSKVPCHEA